jgi:hypothetical protein
MWISTFLTRYTADFLSAVSNKTKPVKFRAYVVLGFLDVPLRHPVSGQAVLGTMRVRECK